MQGLSVTADAGQRAGGGDPVFVLCMGRSGSTLLRFLLDAHPDLACPPETNLPALCAQLAVVWSLIEGAPLSPARGEAPPAVPDPAVAGIRHTVDLMTGSYLARRGKARFCDKSLGTARYADLLLRIYPEARFVCLFRHPMDVIRSGLDACPWGLTGYGFEGYAGASPGNAVLALARYWLDQATAIADVAGSHPDRCHRVRYEDLVEAPEQVADQIFGFLGVPPVPGIAQGCLAAEHERLGPADHKIWHTSAITADSVGRGESVPAGLIPPPVLEQINGLLDKLGYVRVDETWGTADMPADLRADAASRPGPGQPAAGAAQAAPGHGQDAGGHDQDAGHDQAAGPAPALAERLAAGIARIDHAFTARWAGCGPGTFTLTSRPRSGAGETTWHIDLGAAALIADGGDGEDGEDGEDDGPGWGVIGSPQAWQAVLSGELNLSAALRRCELRYCDDGGTGMLLTDTRIAMLSDLLGLTPWQHPPAAAQGAPGPLTAAR